MAPRALTSDAAAAVRTAADTRTRAPLSIALMLESDGPGGAEVIVFQLAEELRRRGHHVHPVGPRHGVGWLGARFRDAGFAPETFHLRRPLDWDGVRQLEALFRRLRVDVVHSHEFTMAVYGTMAARRVDVPHVITMHGKQGITSAWRRRVALRWAYRNSRATVAVSQATKRSMDEELGLASDVIDVIPNGIPLRPGHPDAVRRELGVQRGEVLLLAVGNLDKRKGHAVLLEALHRLDQEQLPVRWRLAIAGGRGGDERPVLERYAAEHGMSDRIHILTHRDDVPNLQAAADVFVMPSLWEGLPLAVLEAMLAGNPIIASRTSGIPEAVTHDVEGLLVPPGDVTALASALRTVLVDPDARARLGDAALRRAQRQFTIATMADAYERLYHGPVAR